VSAGQAAAVCVAVLAAAARPVCAAAQADAEAGADVLALAPSPRATALGGAYAAGAPYDPFALFATPAGIAGPGGPGPPAGVPGGSVAAAYRAQVGDAASGSLAARFAGLGGAGAFAVRYVDYGEVAEIVPDPAFGGERGVATGSTVRGTEVALSTAYAYHAGPLAVGAGLDVVRTDLAELQDVAVAGSVGARLVLWGGRVALGTAVQHLGPDAAPGSDAPLPRTYRGGMAVELGSAGAVRLRVAADASGPWDRLRASTGAEVGVEGSEGVLLLARVGWDGSVEDGDALEAVSWGGGLVAGRLTVDYAYRGIGVLGAAHQVGVRLRR
jgi:hypothetical protein